MSWLLKYNNRLLLIIFVFIVELGVFLIIQSKLYVFLVLFLDALAVTVLYMANLFDKYMLSQMTVFYSRSIIRNIDYLLIGEKCDPQMIIEQNEASYSYVQLKIPDLSEFCAYQILKRTHSILKEGGTAIIAIKKSNLGSQKIRILDTYFLHEITINKYNLKRKKKFRKLYFLLHPLKCLFLMYGNLQKGFVKAKSNSSTKDFCKQRNIQYALFVK